MTHISDITVPAVVTAATCLTGPFSDLGGSVKQQRLILVACMYTEHKVSKMFQNTLNEHPFRLSPVLL